MKEEIWKPVAGFEGLYEVSNLGRVRSLTKFVRDSYFYNGRLYKGRILKTTKNDYTGYVSVMMMKDGKGTRRSVHRLVATAFLPNPDNLPVINHKDQNKTNNCVDNLEWCTQHYNTHYMDAGQRRLESARKGKKGRYPKYVAQYDLDGNYITTYSTSQEAARALGVCDGGNIRACARGAHGYSQAYGFVWKYVDSLP